MSVQHDLFSPSSAHRWLCCPGAVAFCENIPEAPSADAELGTKAHAVAEQAIKNRFGYPEEALPLSDLTDDADMVENAAAYANWIADNYSDIAEFKTETWVDLSSALGRAEAGGTVDAYFTTGGSKLVVLDYKYGRHPVAPERNPQLMLYAAGVINGLAVEPQSVDLVVYQPYCGGAKAWTTDAKAIREFATFARNKLSQAEQIRVRVHNGEDVRSSLVPGPEQCRYCRGAGTCPALAQQALAVAEVKPTEPAPEALPVPSTPEQLARALPWLDLIEKWCEKVRSAAHGMIESGTPVPGYKLVEGRAGPRKWADGAEEAINAMSIKKAVLYVPKLISPAEAERMAKKGEIGPRQWKNIQPLITRTPPKPCLVPESDKRPAIEFNTADEFDALEGDLF